eukprot:COSAG06_NODE_3432_length_5355_cov_9.890982_5_plen_85_part_00
MSYMQMRHNEQKCMTVDTKYSSAAKIDLILSLVCIIPQYTDLRADLRVRDGRVVERTQAAALSGGTEAAALSGGSLGRGAPATA